MKNWNLFANGNFKIKLKTHALQHEWRSQIIELDYETLKAPADDPENCTLIARPISDMTDEEVERLVLSDTNHLQGLQYQVDDLKDDISEMCRNGHLTRGQFLNLLFIGVYPFDQSHFGDTVINANSLEEA